MAVGIIWDKTNMITMRITMAVEISISKYYKCDCGKYLFPNTIKCNCGKYLISKYYKMRLWEISYFQYYTMAKGILIFPIKCGKSYYYDECELNWIWDIYTTLNF